MRSPTEENYLKALLKLSDEDGQVSATALGKQLGVSSPSVNSMVRKLSEKGLVHYAKYKPLSLTEAGRKAAALIVRKHRLTEMFLVEKMGFGWEEVHTIAEQIEHVESPAFFKRMDDMLGYPSVDPHGSPIPTPEGQLDRRTSHQKLSDRKEGEVVSIVALAHSSNDFLHFLNERQLRLNDQLRIEGVEAFDGSMRVAYGDGLMTVLSKLVCDKILVVPV
ncbi:metal-dependent transcriptional regulator [Lewinella sp. 4G2]|uniref:metal-dependent transcriptional regulator n=1 Tax=Lewinella sp. 4G2 TaxID=1803372 RepID=UPI0007B499FA|nr:metal-dependent transcriptional regulator [Lewinella sp. 4G2]OAV45355.1 iron (metal) dependent repressor, dtxr family protein [Lewinella sp. 4G2]